MKLTHHKGAIVITFIVVFFGETLNQNPFLGFPFLLIAFLVLSFRYGTEAFKPESND